MNPRWGEEMSNQPLWLWIDPTNDCGLKCHFCYTKRSHGSAHLSPAMLRRYLEILLNAPGISIQKLNFNWRGDPLMNPDFLSLLQEIEDRNLTFPVEFHTNGTTIDEKMADDLASVARRVLIFVSVDGGNEASHDFNRGEGTYRKALHGLDLLLRARGERARPFIGLFQLDLGVPHERYDPEFIRLAETVDEWVRINPIHPTSGRRIHVRVPAALVPAPAEPDRLITVAPTDRWWAREVPQDARQPQRPCFWAGNALFIAPGGDVSVCLLSHTRDGILGNLLTTSLAEILDNASRWRSKISRVGRTAIPHCAKCRVFEGEPRPQIL